jgi:hypothetical protein
MLEMDSNSHVCFVVGGGPGVGGKVQLAIVLLLFRGEYRGIYVLPH